MYTKILVVFSTRLTLQ